MASSNTQMIPLRNWGHSRAIRITKSMLEFLKAEDASVIEISYTDDGILLHTKTSRQTLEEYAKPYGGKLGPYTEFNWGDGLGFERWIDEAT